ncbi:MAG: hypothetical protein J6T10_24505 [Methanobrevibacter sp.]|nr:hypothetical protein [Methanobrevibacter sp.]
MEVKDLEKVFGEMRYFTKEEQEEFYNKLKKESTTLPINILERRRI